ncbi:IS30 family transposase [Allofrancisella inopinata]|nr:IS30 family transposase [Allofrancisella inopinata]
MIDERPANVERKSGKLIATKLPNKCSQSVLEGTGMTVYFARAYAFWQKGTNESTNGLLRQFIPKGTDFDTVSDEDLQRYVNLINNRPRKRHQWLTPNQVFEQGLNMCRASV